MEYEYRVVGINLESTPAPAPDPAKASSQLNVSREFIEKEFAEHYQSNKQNNTPLQIQNLLNMYGRRGWAHYYEGKIGHQVLLYFRRAKGESIAASDFLLRSRPSFRNWQMSKSPNEGQSLVNLQRADQQSCLSASAFSDEAWVFEMESRRLWPTLGCLAER